jgi:hypothetical protein
MMAIFGILFIESFIILDIHPHGKQQGLKRADKQKNKGQHGYRRNVLVCEQGYVGDFDHIGNSGNAQDEGEMIKQEQGMKIENQILNPESFHERLQ